MISVVVPSIRSHTIGDTIASIVSQTENDWELIVSDQSGNDSLTAVIASFGDTRVRRVCCPGRGASLARNFGIVHAQGDVIAFTDDDCCPRPDWLVTIRTLFAANPDLWMATGSLVAPPGKLPKLHTGTYVPQERRTRPSTGGERIYSVTANAAYRRLAFEKAGPFDVCLSPGTEFCGGEEDDHGQRMELFDPVLMSTPRMEVEHTHGVRIGFKATWVLKRNYAISIGALAGKQTLLGGAGIDWAWRETRLAFKGLYSRAPKDALGGLARAYYIWKGYNRITKNYRVDQESKLLISSTSDLKTVYAPITSMLKYHLPPNTLDPASSCVS